MALDLGRRLMHRALRAPGARAPSVAIVGAGLSGLAMAMQLCRSGVTDMTILEQSDGVGGTWRDNTYPGSGCDVPSHLYSFSFASKTDWSRRFAEQPEILGYAEDCVDRFDLARHIRFNTTVEEARFDEEAAQWHLTVSPREGPPDDVVADVVIFACGQLNRPAVPHLPGAETFEGTSFHSARWDHGCSLEGRRVAVVGNGASAIQFVPPVAGQASVLTIFQRSTNYVGPKPDRAYGAMERWCLEHIRPLELAYRWKIYWSFEARWLLFRRDGWVGRRLTRRFDDGIRTQVVSERLPEASVVPDYPLGCKRILISNDWYPALHRSNVEVVTDPIDHLETDAVVTAGGRRVPADVLIYATGFHTTDFLSHITVTGSGGRKLADQWATGAEAYLGMAIPGFPNCFVLYGPNTNLGHNSILFMVERQVSYVLHTLALTTAAGRAARSRVSVDVKPEAYRRDGDRTQRLMTTTAWAGSCRSWYKTATGRITNNWPSWTLRYWLHTLRVRRDDLVFHPVGAPTTDDTVVGAGAHHITGSPS
ncbi:MAG TPA: NAD(P)/FAD-dependent oxidoreductase [Acidimicrobiales bacterium]|nr:NAD(P)/FAD-dependent oxidoreductase [Acidimicrobiales bacterium]